MSKSKMDTYTSEYCMSAGDNAVSRKQIDKSVISKATANEGEYVKALKKGLDKIDK